MTLGEDTLIPLGLAVIAIGGGAMWLTTMHNKVVENAKALYEYKLASTKELDELKNSVSVIVRDHATVLQSLARIEEILRYLQKEREK